MCQKCVDAVRKHWPELPEEDMGTLLMSCTAFPFADPKTTERQVAEMAEKSGRDLYRAIIIAEAELDEEMPSGKSKM